MNEEFNAAMWYGAYAVAGLLTFILWKIECYIEACRTNEKTNYSQRYYSRSASSDNAIMITVCILGWPFILSEIVSCWFRKEAENE